MTIFWGTTKKETIHAHNSNDIVIASDGDDTIFGSGGDDLLKGGGGADKLFGGPGSDTADYSDSWEGVFVSLADGTALKGTAQGDTFSSIENLNGSAHSDFLEGDHNANILKGLASGDLLEGLAGADILEGGEGGDILIGGAGPDRLIGGPGEDLAGYDGSEAGVFVSLLDHIARFGDAEGDTLDSIADLSGSSHDDALWGDHERNFIDGRDGSDIVKGYGGNDVLRGGLGDDTLLGQAGDDYLYGGALGVGSLDDGSDTLNGGLGRDFLEGGTGDDTFVWLATDETSDDVTALMDVIWDFAQGDHIDLSGIDADISVPGNGNQAFTFIDDDLFSGTPGELRYRYEGGNTIIEMQTGSSGDPEGAIVIVGIHTPTAEWFVL